MDDHIKILGKYIPKFRAADPKVRERIIQEAAESIERAWGEEPEFDRDAVINACEFPFTLKHTILKHL